MAASTFNEFGASFSPDGSKIAFASDRTGEGDEIWIVNSDGTGRRQVTRGVRRPEGSPRWSPDGKRLAFDGLRALSITVPSGSSATQHSLGLVNSPAFGTATAPGFHVLPLSSL